jgi:hypothetical protein
MYGLFLRLSTSPYLGYTLFTEEVERICVPVLVQVRLKLTCVAIVLGSHGPVCLSVSFTFQIDLHLVGTNHHVSPFEILMSAASHLYQVANLVRRTYAGGHK